MACRRIPAAVFVFAVGLAQTVGAGCPPPEHAQTVKVAHVIDGDTLILSDGVRLRLIGVDTPELGRDGAPDEPYAAAARTEMRRLVRASAGTARIAADSEPRDHYGRRLAHGFDRDGRNLSEHLLRQGLGYQVTLPPNVRYSDCYLEAETEARRHGRGLWRMPALDAGNLPADASGFERVEGEVRAVRSGRGATWIELKGTLQLRILDEDLPWFDAARIAALPGTRIEVRGWIYRHRGEPRMRLRHPSALRRP